jgi:two-component system, OmpR family, response regulator QseB
MLILIVEDDLHLGRGLQRALERWGHTHEWVRDGASALARAKAVAFDMILLDLGLPKVDGLDVLAAMSRDHVSAPILVITARDSLQDRVRGLDLGADDYLVKPFELDELAARMRSVMRRTHGIARHNLEVGGLAVDTQNSEARFEGRLLNLSRVEFRLLQTLAERAGRVVTREFLVRVLYGPEGVGSNALEVHVHSLRKKIHPNLIRTARGLGYLLTDEKLP